MEHHLKGSIASTGMLFALTVVFVVVILGIGAITTNALLGSSGMTERASSTINNTSIGILNLSAQLPTVGTIFGVALILVVLFGAIGYLVMRAQ